PSGAPGALLPARHPRDRAGKMVAMASLNLLSARGLSRHFGGLNAVDSVDFDLPAGEIRAIIGPNGAGKTTFVGLICGRVAPNAGRIAFAGEDITSLPAHRRVHRGIAYTFQATSVFGRLSAFNNVALAVQSCMHSSASASPAARRRKPPSFPMVTSGCSKWRWAWRSGRSS